MRSVLTRCPQNAPRPPYHTVSLIVSSIAYVAYRCIMPELCGDSVVLWSVILLVTVIFEVNIFFNYFMSVFAVAGSTKEWPAPALTDAALDGASFSGARCDNGGDGGGTDAGAAHMGGGVARHAFRDCRLCVPCGRAKPPKAHHCRTCGICVQGMDHHCPFVNNCVVRPQYLTITWDVAFSPHATKPSVLFSLHRRLQVELLISEDERLSSRP